MEKIYIEFTAHLENSVFGLLGTDFETELYGFNLSDFYLFSLI